MFFVNCSSDLDNEYFSDGISEEIINVLICICDFKVIVCIFFFFYKGKVVDIWIIGEELDVVIVLEGSVCWINVWVWIIV